MQKNPMAEDNRIIYVDINNEHMITEEEKNVYIDRYISFFNVVSDNADKF